MQLIHPSLLSAFFACLLIGCSSGPASAPAAKEDASIASPREGRWFMERHEAFLQRAREGPVGLLFLGDSITEGWAGAPGVWDHYYAKWNAANFGVAGDKTQHLLWRITHGELDALDPAVVVLMIGTNNSGDATADQIVRANARIVEVIRQRLPRTRILLLALFPRGPRSSPGGEWDDGVTRMAVIDAVNARLAGLDNGTTVRFLNINPVFLDRDGRIPRNLMPDQLHLSRTGYERWARAMDPLLQTLMTADQDVSPALFPPPKA
jgi:beta-glucosidase